MPLPCPGAGFMDSVESEKEKVRRRYDEEENKKSKEIYPHNRYSRSCRCDSGGRSAGQMCIRDSGGGW